MRGIFWALAGVAAFVAAANIFAPPTTPTPAEAKPAAPERKATGIEKREHWTTSKVVGSPEPPDPYSVAKVYPKLTFFEALELTPVPGAKAWVVAERPGKIFTLDMDPKKAEKRLILDVKHTVYGAVLHPKFAENGYLYLSEVPNTDKETSDGTHVVRYTVDRKTMTADPRTRKLIFTWPNGGHNGGCLRFAPDGTLYLSTGDGSGIADSLQTGQDLGTVLGKILRIDVDKEESGKAYAIPRDNPFAATKGARGEIWAYGIRQSWKISFDTATGDLWAGEVGQDLWESVYRIE
jgi:glucose/arabinose dehydrogenase